MNVKIIDKSSHYVLEDGAWFCQHEHTEVMPVDFGCPDRYKCDYIDDWRDCNVCLDCDEVLGEAYGWD